LSRSASQILYVDQEDGCRRLVRLLLEAEGDIQVTTVGETGEALELIGAGKFDLYIFDHPWRHPVALELCRQVREKDEKTPILILSVMPREADRDQALAAGANEYLIKPDDINRLAETVERLLRGTARPDNSGDRGLALTA
jgi:DNA-binding response OmpR family regulator